MVVAKQVLLVTNRLINMVIVFSFSPPDVCLGYTAENGRRSPNDIDYYYDGSTDEVTDYGGDDRNGVVIHQTSHHKRKCPIAFNEIGGRCYFYGYFKLNWFRAMEFCHSFGQSVSLACIETDQENQSLKRWLLLNGNSTAKKNYCF